MSDKKYMRFQDESVHCEMEFSRLPDEENGLPEEEKSLPEEKNSLADEEKALKDEFASSIGFVTGHEKFDQKHKKRSGRSLRRISKMMVASIVTVVITVNGMSFEGVRATLFVEPAVASDEVRTGTNGDSFMESMQEPQVTQPQTVSQETEPASTEPETTTSETAALPCDTCGGTGKCEECQGDGYLGVALGYKVDCPRCHGTLIEVCAYCDAGGNSTQHEGPCDFPHCMGSHVYPCTICGGGTTPVECKSCHGTGKCTSCGGTGRRS